MWVQAGEWETRDMTNNKKISLLDQLKEAGIIKGDKINVQFKTKLNKNADLIQKIIEATSYLLYDAPLKVRLHCVMQGITEQPRCSVCDTVVEMRTDGVYRYTFPTYCSSKCSSSDSSVKSKRRQTNIKKYGTGNVLTSEHGRAKTKQSLMDKYGVDNPTKVPEIRAKQIQTNNEKYGTDYSCASEEVIKKRMKTNLERYGVENIFLDPMFREQIEQTNLERYGYANPFENPEVQQNIKTKMVEKYGAPHPTQVPELRRRALNRMMEKYGVEYALQSDQLAEHVRVTMIEKYGVEYALQNEDIKKGMIEQATKTMIEKYGCKSYQQWRLIQSGAMELLNDEEWLRAEYIENQRTHEDIGKELGVAHSTVGLYLKKFGIPTNPQHTSSFMERQVVEFVKSVFDGEVITNDRTICTPHEIDIYIPSKHLAIEFNGLYWHSELQGKTRSYHVNKTKACNLKRIHLVHIFENEWVMKQEIVKSRLRSLLGKSERIFARKCLIEELSFDDANDFLNKTHIQGNTSASVCLGLRYNNEIVAVMTFSKSRYSKKYQYELIRYATKLNTNVIGGAGKLFKYFVKNWKPTSIVSYSDIRWNRGTVYTSIGMTHSHNAAPNYFYFLPGELNLMSRVKFQKHKLEKILETFNPLLTEWENMVNNGFNRIWDCGNMVFVWFQH